MPSRTGWTKGRQQNNVRFIACDRRRAKSNEQRKAGANAPFHPWCCGINAKYAEKAKMLGIWKYPLRPPRLGVLCVASTA